MSRANKVSLRLTLVGLIPMILKVSGARVTEVANFLVHFVASGVECRFICAGIC